MLKRMFPRALLSTALLLNAGMVLAGKVVLNVTDDFDPGVVSRIALQMPATAVYDPARRTVTNRATGRAFRLNTFRSSLGDVSVTGAKLYYQDVKPAYRLYVHEIASPFSSPRYNLQFFVKLSSQPEFWLSCTGDFLPSVNDAQGIVDICRTAQLK